MDKVKLKSKLNQLNKKANVILDNLYKMDNQTKPLMIDEMSNILNELTKLSNELSLKEDVEDNE